MFSSRPLRNLSLITVIYLRGYIYGDTFRFNDANFCEYLNRVQCRFTYQVKVHTTTGRLHPLHIHHEDNLLLCFLNIFLKSTTMFMHIKSSSSKLNARMLTVYFA